MSNGYLTFPVAGAAYGKLASIAHGLTHSYNPQSNVVLCGKVKPESILDDYSFDTEAIPSCLVCAKRLATLTSERVSEAKGTLGSPDSKER